MTDNNNNSYSITQFGKPLSKDKYTIDFESRTLSTIENNLVLDFRGLDNWTFNTGSNCTFNTYSDCTFKTGSWCTFATYSNCTFDTGYRCTFNTYSECTFKTGSYCTFDTGYGCTFDTGSYCFCIRRDINELIEIPENVTIKLNSFGVLGYTIVKETVTNQPLKRSTKNDEKLQILCRLFRRSA
jgi:hypothetical protein